MSNIDREARLNGDETVFTTDSTVTKREYLAAKAMQGICASERWVNTDYDTLADFAVKQADALLRRLAK